MEPGFVAPDRDDLRPGLRQPQRRRTADPAAGAGDERDSTDKRCGFVWIHAATSLINDC
jgi:hypothetical protein